MLGSPIQAARFEQFIDLIPDAILGVDGAGVMVLVNAQTELLFGYTRSELLGRPVEMLMPERFGRVHPGHRAAYFADPRTRPMGAKLELFGRHKYGREFPAVISLSSIESDAGTLAIAAVRDMTEHVEMQRMFEQFVNFAPDAIVGVNAAGEIVLVNTQTEALFGYAREQLVSKPVEMLIPERFREAYAGHRDGYFTDPRARLMGAKLELFGLRRDGSEFQAETSLSSIGSAAGPLALVAIRDMSERAAEEHKRKALESELKASVRVESDREREALEQQLNQLRRSESVGQLAGGIAHDFNNILGVIINYSGFVAEEIGADSPAQRDVLEIRRAAERAAALTRQLLIFSRREVVRPQVLDLNALVANLDRLLRRALGEHIELETRFEPELWTTEADPGQMEQVLVNLAVNARDAMSSGGQLVIETANVEIDVAYSAEDDVAPGRYVRISVSDTGVGMQRETVTRAFEPFYSTKPRGEGTGLGLSTVYGIVIDAGGQVRIDSEPGAGTTMRVDLPASSRAPTAHRPPATERAVGGRERIVVAEDEGDVRRMIKRILANAGYDVLVTSGGAAAIEVLGQPDLSVDLLLTDVVMPEMLGPELVERAQVGRPELVVLYMSGYIPEMLGSGNIDPTEVEFIEKPFTAEALLIGVRGALDRADAIRG